MGPGTLCIPWIRDSKSSPWTGLWLKGGVDFSFFYSELVFCVRTHSKKGKEGILSCYFGKSDRSIMSASSLLWRCPCPNPGSCKYVRLHGIGDVWLRMEFWLLFGRSKIGRLSWIIWMGPRCLHMHLIRREAEGELTEGDKAGWPRGKRLECRGHKSKSAGGRRKLGGARNGCSLEPLEGVWPCWHFDLGLPTPISDCGL